MIASNGSVHSIEVNVNHGFDYLPGILAKNYSFDNEQSRPWSQSQKLCKNHNQRYDFKWTELIFPRVQWINFKTL